MNGGMLLLIALAIKLFQTYFTKSSSLVVKGQRQIVLFTAWRYLLCVLLAGLLLLWEGGGSWNGFAFGIAALGGLSLALCGVCQYVALQRGAMVLTQLAAMSGLLVPCIAGIWLFDEPLLPKQLLGILLLLTAAWLLAGYTRGLQEGGVSPLVWISLLLVLLSNGAVMLSQKLFSTFHPMQPVSFYSLLSFGVASGALWCIVPVLPKSGQEAGLRPPKGTGFTMVVLAVAVFLINQTVTAASATLPAAVLFPTLDGLGLVFATVLSAVCFGEKLTRRSLLGMAMGIGGLLLMR